MKNLSNQLIQRQNRILTRLLESEKAVRERGYDEKRESKEGNSKNNSNQIRFDQYTNEKKKQIENDSENFLIQTLNRYD